jgi:hypothetical protein
MSPVTSRSTARALPREDRHARGEPSHLRVVRPRQRPARTGPVVAVALVVVFTSLLASAVFHSVLVSGQGKLDDLQGRVARARQDVAQERLALAEAQSPDKLAVAAQKLGLVVPQKQTWLATPGPNGTTPPPVVVDRGPAPAAAAPTTATTTPAVTAGAAGTTVPAGNATAADTGVGSSGAGSATDTGVGADSGTP